MNIGKNLLKVFFELVDKCVCIKLDCVSVTTRIFVATSFLRFTCVFLLFSFRFFFFFSIDVIRTNSMVTNCNAQNFTRLSEWLNQAFQVTDCDHNESKIWFAIFSSFFCIEIVKFTLFDILMGAVRSLVYNRSLRYDLSAKMYDETHKRLRKEMKCCTLGTVEILMCVRAYVCAELIQSIKE